MSDEQKLLAACAEYRAKVDQLLEENNELHDRLFTIPDEVWSKADLVKQIHQAYAERDELQKENTKLKDALKEEKIDRSLDGWNEAAIINDLKRENAALNETAKKHVTAYYELMAENAALREDNKRLDAAIASWDEERERALREANRVLECRGKCEQLEQENAELREKARLWEETCYGLSAPHYIIDPNLRSSKFREALRSYSAIISKTGFTIGSAQPEAQP